MRLLFAGSNAMIDHFGQIFALIRQHDGVTRHFLAEQLSLPATTLNRSLDRLLAAGLIQESGLADSSGGRRPGLYQINPQSGQLLGLDLSGPAARLVLTDLNLQVLDRALLPAWAGLGERELKAAISSLVQEMLQRSKLNAHLGLGLGVSCPEPDAAASGRLPESQALASELGLPVHRLAAACAPLYAGLWGRLNPNAAPAAQSLLTLWHAEQISLGQGYFVNPTRLITSSGNIGPMIVPRPDKADDAGISLAQLSSPAAMVQRFQRLKADPALAWTDLCQAAQAGKRKASQILQEAAQALAIAVLNCLLGTGIRNLLPEGQVFREFPAYEMAFRTQLQGLAASAGIEVRIMVHPFGLDLGAAGAAARILEQTLNVSQVPGTGMAGCSMP
jgi:predicted NBD/HSP70 family sugar kinase